MKFFLNYEGIFSKYLIYTFKKQETIALKQETIAIAFNMNVRESKGSFIFELTFQKKHT